jgi:AcrR family transcriptional regulator
MDTALDRIPERPRGRDQVTNALLAATERLCAKGQPSSITVNDIAHEAGVTTSLLYFYFESKDELILVTLRSIATEMNALAAGTTEPGEIAATVSRSLRDRPAFARILAWLVLEGRSTTQGMGGHPFLERLVATLATNQAGDPITTAGAVVAMLLSNALLTPGINVALGRDADDARLVDALDASIAAALTAQD